MLIKLWGVRGSLPTPMDRDEVRSKLVSAIEHAREAWRGEPDREIRDVIDSMHPGQKSIIGGETTCVEVRHGEVELIFDMGTGARRLGIDMMQRGHKGDINVLFTHTHWDHIQGWLEFQPAFQPDNTVHFYSCLEDLEERLALQQHPDHSSLRFADIPCKKVFHYIPPGDSFDIGECHVTTQPLIHPGGSISYKVEAGGKTFIFATDTEFYGPEIHERMKEYNRFFHGADLLVMDAQYSLEEAEQRKGWGHTAMTIAVDCSLYWNVKELVLTHHEPAHSDESIWKLFDEASEYLVEFAQQDKELKIYTAKEGDSYSLE
jgi:phosphoribosyl 1,2-cyclic phosphodiesterase